MYFIHRVVLVGQILKQILRAKRTDTRIVPRPAASQVSRNGHALTFKRHPPGGAVGSATDIEAGQTALSRPSDDEAHDGAGVDFLGGLLNIGVSSKCGPRRMASLDVQTLVDPDHLACEVRADEKVVVLTNGQRRVVPAGTRVCLPGPRAQVIGCEPDVTQSGRRGIEADYLCHRSSPDLGRSRGPSPVTIVRDRFSGV